MHLAPHPLLVPFNRGVRLDQGQGNSTNQTFHLWWREVVFWSDLRAMKTLALELAILRQSVSQLVPLPKEVP